MLANLKPGARLELYLAGLCFSMLGTIAVGGWWVSQRQAIAGDNLSSTNPHYAGAARRGNALPRDASRQPGTAIGGADGPYQSATSRMSVWTGAGITPSN